jgi:pimeloyl-ACP methyl ester carboxylesterase
MLHGLGEATDGIRPEAQSWPGPVFGLDFTGHGLSSLPAGGGYTAEVLMADVDAAVAEIGPCTLMGRGLGSYVALLAAGGRPDMVRGAILTDGPGLVGGGIRPHSAALPHISQHHLATPDPLAMYELARDVRPPDYALDYVRQAVEWSGLEHPISVCTRVRPEWLAAVADHSGVADTTVAQALAGYCDAADS